MPVTTSTTKSDAQHEIQLLKEALDSIGLTIRAFCDYLAEELAEPGHEDESSAEKFRGWFKKGRSPKPEQIQSMWSVLREHPDFIKSKMLKPQCHTKLDNNEFEACLKQLSRQITDTLQTKHRD